MGDNIRIASVLEAEAAGDDAQADEAQLLIQMKRAFIAGDNGVELEDTKAQLPGLVQAVDNQLFADMPAAQGLVHGVAGVGNMAAAAYVVGMQDIQPADRPARQLRHGGEGLAGQVPLY